MLDAMAMRQLQVGSACWGVVETSAMTATLSRGAAAVSRAVATGLSAEEIALSSDSLRDALDDASEVADAFAAEMAGAVDSGATDEDVERELAAMEEAGAVDAGALGIPGAAAAGAVGAAGEEAGAGRAPAAAGAVVAGPGADAEAAWAIELPPVPAAESVPRALLSAPTGPAGARGGAAEGPALA
ncbi:hypothetical protein FNF31_04828 [Cafeteria roenbergensis]|uniref:Uncharacterized protein n=1 Tax=Cafeteria roenbergensis TaxID=33653 RepID=A0A5A8D1W1_CAFRO|nr:hypothetical protein FNF31_04828 [Cafeteria roenbergensis]